RKYLQSKGLWTDQDEEQTVEQAKDEVNAAIQKADAYPKMTVPGLIDSMFANLPPSLRAQRAEFEAKEEA
ncbi:MAG: pyruvate dehydrogenase (acetyl-transferring) E1 component subunit alpha, partial [Alicyclobacillus sp.]|nr:pyruvate dehydrogenase (acetyl-transferring) E1 component subunit alpha [Alicyclobacillus sp.]